MKDDNMRDWLRSYLGISELDYDFKCRKRDHEYDIKSIKSRVSEIDLRTISAVSGGSGSGSGNQKETKVAEEFTSFGMNKDGVNLYEIVRKSTGRFYACEGFPSVAVANLTAEKLALKYPQDEFFIVGPLRSVKANIPIVSVDLNVPAVSDGNDKAQLLTE